LLLRAEAREEDGLGAAAAAATEALAARLEARESIFFSFLFFVGL
jgi:hypothetical protein